MTDLQVGQHYQTWYRLQHHEPKQKEKKCVIALNLARLHVQLWVVMVSILSCRKELGSLRLKVHCHLERILHPSLYVPFVKLMLSAVETPLVSVFHHCTFDGIVCVWHHFTELMNPHVHAVYSLIICGSLYTCLCYIKSTPCFVQD